MAKNKIVYGNEILLDISGDTAVEADVMSGKTFHRADGTQATGTKTITLQQKTAIPLETQQNITPDSGYDGLSDVTIEAVSLQTKTASPSDDVQTVTPDTGYMGLEQVTVSAIPATRPDVSSDTATEADVISGKTFHKADGTQATGTMANLNKLLKTIMSMTTDCQDIDLTGLGITYIKPFLFKHLDYAYNTTLKSIVMPDVTDIGRESFKNCAALTSVTFGSGLKTIDSYAFHSCSKMVVSEIPGAQIQTGAFYGCSKIIDLKLGDGVSLGDEAFKMCSGLETLTIEANAGINGNPGYEPFANCSALNTVKVLGLPAKDKYTDNYYFENIFSSSCSSLTDIYVSWPENEVPNAPWGAPSTVTVHYDTQFDDEGEPII